MFQFIVDGICRGVVLKKVKSGLVLVRCPVLDTLHNSYVTGNRQSIIYTHLVKIDGLNWSAKWVRANFKTELILYFVIYKKVIISENIRVSLWCKIPLQFKVPGLRPACGNSGRVRPRSAILGVHDIYRNE